MPSQAETIAALRQQSLGGVDPVLQPPQSPADPTAYSQALGIPDAVRALSGAVYNAASLPKQLLDASEQLRTTGEYNAQPAGDAMLLAAGGLPGAEAGAAGVFGGRLARNANLNDLNLAQEMHAAGHSPEQIYDATKWFRGADNKWRFEIPDTNAQFVGHGSTVGQFMHHPELFDQYPELRAASMDLGYKGGLARYNPATNEIGINMSEVTSPANATSKGLHEGQHWVQHKEGFAPGGSPRDVLPLAQQVASKMGGDPSDLAFEAYRRHAGEVEARNVQSRFDMGTGAQSYYPWQTEDTPKNLQIIRPQTGGNQEALRLLPRTLLPKSSAQEVQEALSSGKGNHPVIADYLYGHGETNPRSFDIANDQGQKVARMWTAQHNPNDLYVNYIAALDPKSGAIANATGEAANVLGTREMRSLIPELKKQFPDVNTVGGFRVSGARAANPSSTILKLK